MARRKTRTVYRTRVKRAYKRASTGGMKPIIDGAISGFAGQFLSKWIGSYGHPAAAVAVGYWRKNNTLKTEGARALGAMLADKVPFLGGAGSQGGVF